MAKIKLKKEVLSIQSIGQLRFWFGILAGVVSALATALAFNQSREVFRLFTGMSADLLVLDHNELVFFNYFFTILASVLGLAVAIWIWMGNLTHNRKIDSLYRQLSRTNALLIFWLILMMIGRFGSVLPFILYGLSGYDGHLNLHKEYWMLFVLIPVVVFAQSWFSVRLVYRSEKWILISFLICLISGFILSKGAVVDQEKLNNTYFSCFEQDYVYVDKEIASAELNYGIRYDPNTIETLKKWHTQSAVEQVISVKKSFAQKSKVSMGTIVLQKVIIHNFKSSSNYYYRNSIENWHYALPNDVLKQIQYFDIDSNETKELFEILKEQIDLINTPEIEWEAYENHTETEIRRSRGVKYNIPQILVKQLRKVRQSLVSDKKYTELAKILPELD